MASSRILLACVALAALASSAQAFMPPASDDGFFRGRATFFGAPDYFAEAYKMHGSFGDFLFGSCGYFNKPRSKQKLDYDDLQLPLDGVAALADVNPDFPGSCGRCYEVRCSEGLLKSNRGDPIWISEMRTYMPGINDKVNDTRGRAFPGNPAEKEGRQWVRCWNESSVVVKIVDNCPATTSNFAGHEALPQYWCSADIYHFDLSYWAFEKLAHPIYGTMNVDFRPVDCYTHQPLRLTPGFVSRVIYSSTIEAGWSWQTFRPAEQHLMAAGQGHTGATAACTSILPRGGVTFNCRRCAEGGYQPFNGVGSISLWIKPVSNVGSNGRLAVKISLGRPERNQYCDTAVYLEGEGALETLENGYKKFDIPIWRFACDRLGLNNVEALVITNTDEGAETAFCMDDIELHGGGPWHSVPPKPPVRERPDRSERIRGPRGRVA